MGKTQPSSSASRRSGGDTSAVAAAELSRIGESWLLVCDISRHSERTIGARRDALAKLSWYLTRAQIAVCDTAALRGFLHHVTHGHTEPGGRWGNPRNRRPTSPGTVQTYHRILRAFFAWAVREGEITGSPMERVTPPVHRQDAIRPFSLEQVERMLAAARKTTNPRRDEAIVLLLLDCGIRASELCGLTIADVDLQESLITVEGKGGKKRHLPFSRDTRRALYNFLTERDTQPDDPLFPSDRGVTSGAGLTRHGLRFLIRRLGTAAGIGGEGVRLSPHTMRHAFATEALRGGAPTFTVQQALGHTSLAQTQRYVSIVQSDLVNSHRQFSPVARLKSKGSKK